MNRKNAFQYISYAVDDAGSPRVIEEMPDNARLVGWQCGFEPLFVAVWSYLGVQLSDEEAEELAADFLNDKDWFADEATPADFII